MRLFVLALFAVGCSAMPVDAAIYRVGSGAGCTHATIQSAIDAAVASATDDEIRISGGPYNNQALNINAAEGRLALLGAYADCTASEPTTGVLTIIDGTPAQSVLRISASADVKLWNLDIQGGRSPDSGGGIRFNATTPASLDLLNTYVRNNVARGGGGIAIENVSSALTADQVRLSLRGISAVVGNAADNSFGGGGGILCSRASVKLADKSHVTQNQSDANGGGLYADNCQVEIGSRGANGAVLWANRATLWGGGVFASGDLATVSIYTVDANVPARVVGNDAYYGSALTLWNGADARLYDVNVEQNIGSVAGALYVLLNLDAPAPESLLVMRGGIDGAPADAVACADPEACNHIRYNTSPDGQASAVLIHGNSDQPDSTTVFLLGTRIEGNTGADHVLSVDPGNMIVEGALIVGNTVQQTVGASESRLSITASTIADNALPAGAPVVSARGDCDAGDGWTRIERSILWQPAHPLINAYPGYPLQTACFQHLVGSDFGTLPAAIDRVVADPHFIDPGTGDYRLSPASPALDFAPAHEGEATRNLGRRVFDLPDSPNRFGPQDLGAYERVLDAIFDNGFDCETC